MMACVAKRIIATPSAIIGSIGVVGQLPNFNRFLKGTQRRLRAAHRPELNQLKTGGPYWGSA
jgi:ClpP class serine protease